VPETARRVRPQQGARQAERPRHGHETRRWYDARSATAPAEAAPSADRVAFASPWRRLFGLLVDGLIIAPVALLLGHVASRFVGEMARLALTFILVVPLVAYQGQTPGERVLRLRVRRVGVDAVPGLQAALTRWAIPASVALLATLLRGQPLGAVLAFASLGIYLPAFWTPRRQGLHDLAAGTIVVDV
jgi:uncharacterized RDD family membrane protein YckC